MLKFEKLRSKDWEIRHSSLIKLCIDPTYEQCQNYSRYDIVNHLTRIPEDSPSIVYLPKGTDFHFIAQTDETAGRFYDAKRYYTMSERLRYKAFSIINSHNVSRYLSSSKDLLFLYDVNPTSIVHVFPCDSDTLVEAQSLDELTDLPSLWLTLSELEQLSQFLETYSQITCESMVNGVLQKPFAILAEGEVEKFHEEVARDFGTKIVVAHPDKDATRNCNDLLINSPLFAKVSRKIMDIYDLDICHHFIER